MKGIRTKIAVAAVLASTAATAQVLDVSPYSWYGLGSPVSGAAPAQMLSGGGTAAYASPLYFNPIQPAALGRLKYTTFDLGGSYQGLRYQNADTSLYRATGGFQNIYLAFPLAKGLGFSAGFQPATTVGYNLSTVVDLPDFGAAKYTYRGSGGLTQAHVALGWSPVRYISIGGRGSYHFGTLTKSTLLDFGDPRLLNVGEREETAYRGWQWVGGAQAVLPLGKKNELEMGYTLSLNTSLSGLQTALQYTLLNNGSSVPTYRDTAWAVVDTPGIAQLPHDQRIGIRWVKKSVGSNLDAWTLSAEWQQSATSLASGFTPRGGTSTFPYAQDARSWRAGATLVPALAFPQAGFRASPTQWQYSAGAGRLETGLLLNGETLVRWNASAGITIPLGTRSVLPGDLKFAALHLGAIWESMGTTRAGLIREDHLRMVVGLTLNDQWFQKFKYR